MGWGDWGFGFPQTPKTPNPQSPIPNPHIKEENLIFCLSYKIFKYLNIKLIYYGGK